MSAHPLSLSLLPPPPLFFQEVAQILFSFKTENVRHLVIWRAANAHTHFVQKILVKKQNGEEEKELTTIWTFII